MAFYNDELFVVVHLFSYVYFLSHNLSYFLSRQFLLNFSDLSVVNKRSYPRSIERETRVVSGTTYSCLSWKKVVSVFIVPNIKLRLIIVYLYPSSSIIII